VVSGRRAFFFVRQGRICIIKVWRSCVDDKIVICVLSYPLYVSLFLRAIFLVCRPSTPMGGTCACSAAVAVQRILVGSPGGIVGIGWLSGSRRPSRTLLRAVEAIGSNGRRNRVFRTASGPCPSRHRWILRPPIRRRGTQRSNVVVTVWAWSIVRTSKTVNRVCGCRLAVRAVVKVRRAGCP